MNRKEEFIKLIDLGTSIITVLKQKSEYHVFIDRYNLMLKELEDLKNAVMNEKIVTSFIYLNVVKMLDHNDPKELEDIIIKINKFYVDNYYEEEDN
ncbi:hypothetical protein [Clostridium hydrogenum]|uniref:hypothetical protein n=1 Tax=Clostridium hydrogenum TaxID=2855764 RepID=UPI001F267D3D|nr:hypothetical protein [Clostridium hydrogenum]